MYGKNYRLQNKLVFFVTVSHFHWLGQTHQLTTESVESESLMIIVQGPKALTNMINQTMGQYHKTFYTSNLQKVLKSFYAYQYPTLTT